MIRAGALLLLLTGCALTGTAPWNFNTDQAGNVWPEVCRHDLASETKETPVARDIREHLSGNNGLYFSFGAGPGFIIIADDLTGWRYADTLHHERCHAVAGVWHG